MQAAERVQVPPRESVSGARKRMLHPGPLGDKTAHPELMGCFWLVMPSARHLPPA